MKNYDFIKEYGKREFYDFIKDIDLKLFALKQNKTINYYKKNNKLRTVRVCFQGKFLVFDYIEILTLSDKQIQTQIEKRGKIML